VEGSFEHDNEPSEFWEILKKLSDWQILKKDSAPWI
jgi:hypothetical protein